MAGVDDVLRRLESMQVPGRQQISERALKLQDQVARDLGEVDQPEGLSFGSMLRQGLQSVSDQGDEVQQKLKGLVTGETESVHEVMSAMGKSEVQFTMLLEVRRKLIEAWQQLTQIRV